MSGVLPRHAYVTAQAPTNARDKSNGFISEIGVTNVVCAIFQDIDGARTAMISRVCSVGLLIEGQKRQRRDVFVRVRPRRLVRVQGV